MVLSEWNLAIQRKKRLKFAFGLQNYTRNAKHALYAPKFWLFGAYFFALTILFSSCFEKKEFAPLEFLSSKSVQEEILEWTDVPLDELSLEILEKSSAIRVLGKDEGAKKIAEFLQNCQKQTISLDLSELDVGNSLDEKWIQGEKSIKSIILPKSLDKIGAFSISLCPNLEKIVFSSKVEVSEGAISWNKSLKSLIFENGASKICAGAICECSILESLSLGNLDFLENSAIFALPALTEISANGEKFFAEDGALYEKQGENCTLVRFCARRGGTLKLAKGCNKIAEEALDSFVRVSAFEANGAIFSDDGVLYSGHGSILLAYPRLKGERNFLVPSSVQKINAGAFKSNPSLKSVVLPPSLLEIGEGAFAFCSSLSKIEIPLSCEKIKKSAFENCEKLKNVAILSPIVVFEERAFRSCSALEEIALPPKAAETNWIFDGCSSLKRVYVSSETRKIGEGAFRGCSSLSEISLPASIQTVCSESFKNCSSLRSVSLPLACTKVDSWAFSGCSSLSSVRLSKVQTLGDFAFEGCSALQTIEIPDPCESVGEGAFRGCSSLSKITVSSKNRFFRSDSGVLLSLNGSQLFAYPSGAKDEKYSIPIFVTKIEPSAFAGNRFLKNVQIPAGVEELRYDSFAECISLETVSIPGTVHSIGAGAFRSCTALNSAVLAEGVKVLGAESFSGCVSLRYAVLPRSLTEIGEGAFRGCEKIGQK